MLCVTQFTLIANSGNSEVTLASSTHSLFIVLTYYVRVMPAHLSHTRRIANNMTSHPTLIVCAVMATPAELQAAPLYASCNICSVCAPRQLSLEQ